MQKYKNFNIVIHMKYHDMFNNTYYQKITLSSNMHVGGKFNEKKAEHMCDVNLKEITTPVKIAKQFNVVIDNPQRCHVAPIRKQWSAPKVTL